MKKLLSLILLAIGCIALSLTSSAAGSTVYFVYDPAPVQPTIPIPNTGIPGIFTICFSISLAALATLIIILISLKKGSDKK